MLSLYTVSVCVFYSVKLIILILLNKPKDEIATKRYYRVLYMPQPGSPFIHAKKKYQHTHSKHKQQRDNKIASEFFYKVATVVVM